MSGEAETKPGRYAIEPGAEHVREGNLGKKNVEQSLKELAKYMKLFKPAFQRVEQTQKSQAYVCGLLGNSRRKNVEQMALGMGEKARSLQYFVGQSQWKTEPVVAIHQRLKIGRASCRERV